MGTVLRNKGAVAAVSSLLPPRFCQSGDSPKSYHGLVPKELLIGKVLIHFKLPGR